MKKSYVLSLMSGAATQIGIMIATGDILFPGLIGLAVVLGLSCITVAIEQVGENLSGIHYTLEGINHGVDQMPKRGYKPGE